MPTRSSVRPPPRVLRLLTGPIGLGVVLAKFVTETALFVASYQFEEHVVFARRPVVALDVEAALPEPDLVDA